MSTDVINDATDKIRIVCNESDDDLFAECIKKKCSLNLTDDQKYIDPLSLDVLQGRVISHNSRCYNDGEQNNGPDEKNPLRSYRHLAHSSNPRDPFTRSEITKDQFPNFWKFNVDLFRHLGVFHPSKSSIMEVYNLNKHNIRNFSIDVFLYLRDAKMPDITHKYFEEAIQYADFNNDYGSELQESIIHLLFDSGVDYVELAKKYFYSTIDMYTGHFDVSMMCWLGRRDLIQEAEELFTRQLVSYDDIRHVAADALRFRKAGLSNLADKLESALL